MVKRPGPDSNPGQRWSFIYRTPTLLTELNSTESFFGSLVGDSKPGKLNHAHRFSDESRWCGAVFLVSRVKLEHFPPKLRIPIITTEGSSLWLERLFSEDTNTVSKRFCIILLCVSSYLLSTGVFMSVWEVYRSVITYRSQVKKPRCSLIYQQAPLGNYLERVKMEPACLSCRWDLF